MSYLIWSQQRFMYTCKTTIQFFVAVLIVKRCDFWTDVVLSSSKDWGSRVVRFTAGVNLTHCGLYSYCQLYSFALMFLKTLHKYCSKTLLKVFTCFTSSAQELHPNLHTRVKTGSTCCSQTTNLMQNSFLHLKVSQANWTWSYVLEEVSPFVQLA